MSPIDPCLLPLPVLSMSNAVPYQTNQTRAPANLHNPKLGVLALRVGCTNYPKSPPILPRHTQGQPARARV